MNLILDCENTASIFPELDEGPFNRVSENLKLSNVRIKKNCKHLSQEYLSDVVNRRLLKSTNNLGRNHALIGGCTFFGAC